MAFFTPLLPLPLPLPCPCLGVEEEEEEEERGPLSVAPSVPRPARGPLHESAHRAQQAADVLALREALLMMLRSKACSAESGQQQLLRGGASRASSAGRVV